MITSKDQLRKLALRARADLGADARAAKSAAIAAHLNGWQPYATAQCLCLYASFGSEVQTAQLLRSALTLGTSGSGSGNGAGAGGTGGWEAGALQTQRIVCLPRVEGDVLTIHRIGGLGGAVVPPAVANSGIVSPVAEAFSDWPELIRSPMGMPEPPRSAPLVQPQSLGLILVPGSAFSMPEGHRLGYGKGFYDRLLASAPQALKVGLCFDAQIFPPANFPRDAHDIPLDVLVTESGVHDLRLA